MTHRPAVDLRYRNFAELLLRRHLIMREGREDDPELDEIEDSLSDLWEKLSDAQRQSLNGAGSDLNWVAKRGAPPPKGRRAEEVTAEDRRSLDKAEAEKDWHAVLHYLRACAPVLPIDELARRRIAAYSGVGLREYAAACRVLTGQEESEKVTAEMIASLRESALDYASVRSFAEAGELGWSPEIRDEEEAEVFLIAHSRGISDGEGRVFGVLRSAEGRVREVGVRHQQVAAFAQAGPDRPWVGGPIWPLHQDILAGLPLQKAIPPKEVLMKMESAGLLTPVQRKRLARGSHA